MTKKELIEKGYIDQYVLGLTTEGESIEVERLANLYPEVQQLINAARHRICSNFNRNLTQPALRNSLLTKRRVILWCLLVVAFFSAGFVLLCREHFSLQENYSLQRAELAREQAKVTQLASFSRIANEQANFLHAPTTGRIKLKGSQQYPEAEVMVFHCENTGKMMLRVIDLPQLRQGQHYEVWANDTNQGNVLIGRFNLPLRYDSLYSLTPLADPVTIEIASMDPYTMTTTPICTTAITK